MITEFDVQACRRLPLAEGVFRLLNYTLDDKGTAKVRLEKGKVVSVKLLD